MFSGAAEFFRTVELRKDLSPAKPLTSARRISDEDRPRGEEDAGFPIAPAEPEASPEPGDTEFFQDRLDLSLSALQAMLTGGAAVFPAYGRPPVQAAAEVEPALAAYRRASETRTAEMAEMPAMPADLQPAADAGHEIFYMLAALEQAGVGGITVLDGQTVYAALRQQCMALGVPLNPPRSW